MDDSDEQFLNTSVDMCLNPEGREIDVNEVQFSKALEKIAVTNSGTITDVSPVQL